jgi:hypothetical protein
VAILVGGCDMIAGLQPTPTPEATVQPTVEFTSTGTSRDGWWWLDDATPGQELVWRLTGFDTTRTWDLTMYIHALDPFIHGCGDCADEAGLWLDVAMIGADGTVASESLKQGDFKVVVQNRKSGDGVGLPGWIRGIVVLPPMPAGSIGVQIRMRRQTTTVGARATTFWLYGHVDP